jgi:hypothetical protein
MNLESESPGTLRACSGLYRDFFIFLAVHEAEIYILTNLTPVKEIQKASCNVLAKRNSSRNYLMNQEWADNLASRAAPLKTV